jgi:hypothetical protein
MSCFACLQSTVSMESKNFWFCGLTLRSCADDDRRLLLRKAVSIGIQLRRGHTILTSREDSVSPPLLSFQETCCLYLPHPRSPSSRISWTLKIIAHSSSETSDVTSHPTRPKSCSPSTTYCRPIHLMYVKCRSWFFYSVRFSSNGQIKVEAVIKLLNVFR